MKTTWVKALATTSAMGLLLALAGSASGAAPAAKKKAPGPIAGEALPGEMAPKAGSRLDVLFVIDSTGSMGGLVEDGKREMRKIVDEILSGDPKPDLRVGLLTYRDLGDDYITKHIPLSRDFDAFYKFMGRVEAGGGGDWEEHVSRAMHVAVSKFNWDLDRNTARMIFIFADAPAHTDYSDGFDFKKEAEIARDRKIVINSLAMNSDETVRSHLEYMSKTTGGIYKVIGTGYSGSDPGDGMYESHDYSDGPAGAAPKSDMGKSVAEEVKKAAEKSGTTYKKPAPAPAPAPKKKTPK